MSSPLGFSQKNKPCATMSAASSSPGPGGDLPDDLITQILVRLPVRYLFRFELICKAWLYNIKSPEFVKMHSKFAADRERPKSFIIRTRTRNSGLRGDVIFRRVNWPDNNDVIDQDLVLPCKFKYFDSVIIKVANGIVCASNRDDGSIFLWNPATSKSKKLPVPIIERRTRCFSVGFGFDSKADDYKVVRLVMSKKYAFVKADVYSANEICWKQIHVGNNFLGKNLICDVCLDGMLYWLTSETMVTYNLNTEKFNNQIELPKVEVTGKGVRKIVEFMDSFALSVRRRGGAGEYDPEMSLWSLDYVSGRGSWSKKISFEIHPEFPQMPRMFLLLKNGSVVAIADSSNDANQTLVLYDPRTKKLETIIVGSVQSPQVDRLYSYTESLVPIPGSE